MRTQLICCYCVVGFFFVFSTSAQNTCKTPTNDDGTCILLENCDPYQNIIRKKPISRDNIILLRNSQCGVESNKPKVCCPLTRIRRDIKIPTSPYLPTNDECGKQMMSSRMSNSEGAVLGEFPWITLLLNKNNGVHCGGVLISRKYILTSASCVATKEAERTFGLWSNIRLGEHNFKEERDCVEFKKGETECSNPPQNIPIEEIIVHPSWEKDSTNYYNDIALIRMKHEANITDYVQPICLVHDENIIKEGEKMIVAGWGVIESGTINPHPIMQKIPLTITNRTQCSQDYKHQLSLHEEQFCAGDQELKRSVCKGFGGAPLMFHNKLDDSWYSIGIVSVGPRRCRPTSVPIILTNVPHYLKWIVQNLKA